MEWEVRQLVATLVEALRRVYHEMVLRRARVRIVAPVQVTMTEPPIFVIGVYRSGTTLLRYILDSHSRISCSPETDFLAPLSQLLDDYGEGRMFSSRLLDMGFDRDHVIRKLREFALFFYGNYAASANKARWADKSPSYVDYLGFINTLFPEAQFVMIYRHGFDQAHSYTRGGTLMRDTLGAYCRTGEDLRLGALRYWRAKVAVTMAFEETYPERCFRIHYEALCADPEGHLRSLFAFLNELWEPAVMEYYRFPHDKGAEDGRTAATRGFAPSLGHYKRWSQDLLESGHQIAGETLHRLGYTVK